MSSEAGQVGLMPKFEGLVSAMLQKFRFCPEVIQYLSKVFLFLFF